MEKKSSFELIFLLLALTYLLIFGVFGVLIGNVKDPKLEAAGWFIVTSIFIIFAMVIVAMKTVFYSSETSDQPLKIFLS